MAIITSYFDGESYGLLGPQILQTAEPEAVTAMQDINVTLVMEADRLDRYGPESIRRYQAMFGDANAAWQEAKAVRLEGDWTPGSGPKRPRPCPVNRPVK